MTKRPRAADEPYTFAGKDPVDEVVERMDDTRDVVEKALLKDSVAAHQAECGCHPEPDGCNTSVDCESLYSSANDPTGQPWHIDPLCKVRPEAKA